MSTKYLTDPHPRSPECETGRVNLGVAAKHRKYAFSGDKTPCERNNATGTLLSIGLCVGLLRGKQTRTDLAVGSSESGQTLTGVAVDAVHTGAAILTEEAARAVVDV